MSGEGTPPKRRGRPAAPDEKRRRHNLTFRIRSDLRGKLEAVAQENGRSISEEVEFLIELYLGLAGRLQPSRSVSSKRDIESINKIVESMNDYFVIVDTLSRNSLSTAYARQNVNSNEARNFLKEIRSEQEKLITKASMRLHELTISLEDTGPELET